MKKIITLVAFMLWLTACVNDDEYSWESDFSDRTATDTLRINIDYGESGVIISGDDKGYVTSNGAHVVVRSNTNQFLLLSLSGQSSNGSLLIYSWKKCGVLLNGLNLRNPKGPAVNNQCGKSFFVMLAPGSVNTLADGVEYASAPISATGEEIDQKATLFSEGQIYFRGTGSLTINGLAKNGIASDDYLVFEGGNIMINMSATAGNGIKANDGVDILGGTLTIDVKAHGARGIKNDARTTISGGLTTITTSGDCKIETTNGITDTTSCAGIKSDSLFTMTAGVLNISSSGDGGKGINCAADILVRGGQLTVATTGSNNVGKPKAVKSDTGIILSGGYFKATCKKSWACDNGVENEDPLQRVTVIGTPTLRSIGKREVIVEF